MALFSRRPKGAPEQSAAEPAPKTDGTVEPADPSLEAGRADDADLAPEVVAPAESPQAAEGAEAAASVEISTSSFRGLGPQAPAPQTLTSAQPAAEAPPATETVPGLRDNVLVREALAALSDPPTSNELLNVARQLLQGHLFLRVKGDARALLAAGKELPLAVASVGDQNFVLAYSSGAALQASIRADGDVETSAMGQPVVAVLRHVLAGPYQGLVIDQASAPARAVLSRELLERLLAEADESLTVKTFLAEERTDATAAAVAEALTRVPLWVAVGGPAGELPGIAEGRASDGSRFLEVFSHPIEVAVMGRSDQPAPLTGAQLAGALRSDEGLTGVVVDPQGPWIRLSRADLAPLLALAT